MFNNILIDLAPTEAIFNDDVFLINTDFRIGIQYELLMSDKEVSNSDKIRQSVALFFYNDFNRKIEDEEVIEVVDYISWFYSGGMSAKEVERNAKVGGSRQKAIYSFEYDADYIYADFMKIYGINLQQIEYLHWWEFKALFKGLDEESKISKIMGYRTMKITKDMSKQEKDHYKNLKRIYKLPDGKTEQEKEQDFHDIMAGAF